MVLIICPMPPPPTPSLPLQASILDLHSGALSMGQQFVNIYRWTSCPCLLWVFFFGWEHNRKADMTPRITNEIVRNKIHSNMVPVINLDASPWELSSPGWVSESPLIHHHLQGQPALFQPPPAPQPSAHLPVPQFTPNLSDRAGGGHRIPGDALAAFNQRVMKTLLPPFHLLTRSCLCGPARHSNLPYLDFRMSLCSATCCEVLIYANKSHLTRPALLLRLCLRVCVFVSALPASPNLLPSRYFGENVRDVFTKEDFQLYR